MFELFERLDLAAATFRNVSLNAAVFEDVNLAEASIRNILQRLAQHDLDHIRQAEALLAELE